MKKQSDDLELNKLWRGMHGAVQPVILRSPYKDYPYHGVGTAFIVEHQGHLFVISAQHVLDSQRSKAEDFAILIRNAGYSLVFDLEAVFKPDYEPHFDILIRRVAPYQRNFLIEKGVYWIGTEFTIDPQYYEDAAVFYVFGFSDEDRAYDYDAKRISASLYYLTAKLINPSIEGMVSLQALDVCNKPFRGFSGSPVIAVIEDQWMFAGMLTLAVEATGIMNFIPAYRIVDYLGQLVEMVRSNPRGLM